MLHFHLVKLPHHASASRFPATDYLLPSTCHGSGPRLGRDILAGTWQATSRGTCTNPLCCICIKYVAPRMSPHSPRLRLALPLHALQWPPWSSALQRLASVTSLPEVIHTYISNVEAWIVCNVPSSLPNGHKRVQHKVYIQTTHKSNSLSFKIYILQPQRWN